MSKVILVCYQPYPSHWLVLIALINTVCFLKLIWIIVHAFFQKLFELEGGCAFFLFYRVVNLPNDSFIIHFNHAFFGDVALLEGGGFLWVMRTCVEELIIWTIIRQNDLVGLAHLWSLKVLGVVGRLFCILPRCIPSKYLTLYMQRLRSCIVLFIEEWILTVGWWRYFLPLLHAIFGKDVDRLSFMLEICILGILVLLLNVTLKFFYMRFFYLIHLLLRVNMGWRYLLSNRCKIIWLVNLLHLFNAKSILDAIFLLLDVVIMVLQLVPSLKLVVTIHITGRRIKNNCLVILVFQHLLHSILLRLVY